MLGLNSTDPTGSLGIDKYKSCCFIPL